MANSSVIQFTEGEWTSGKFIEILGLKIPAFLVGDAALTDRIYFQFPDETGRCFCSYVPQVRWVGISFNIW